MSPEQARGLEGIDARSDIYSLGMTLFLMLTGTPPFSDVSKDEVMFEHIRGVLEWPSDVNPNVSAEASAMIWRMTAREPERRPQSAALLVEELKRLEDKLTAAAEFAPEAPRTPALETAKSEDSAQGQGPPKASEQDAGDNDPGEGRESDG
jgi:serine/threonine-protein kinase